MAVQESIEIKSNGGRPTKSKQVEMRKLLQEHYARGESAYHTSQETGINLKTVCTYFNEFTELLSQDLNYNFILRQFVTKEILLYHFDKIINELKREEKCIRQKIKLQPKKVVWYKLLFSIMLQITKLRIEKYEIEVKPTTQDVINAENIYNGKRQS